MGVAGGIFKAIGAYVTGEALVEALDGVEDRVNRTTKRVIKALTLWAIFLLGALFLLWGFGLFLTSYFSMHDGVGIIIVGGFILLLALLVKAFQ